MDNGAQQNLRADMSDQDASFEYVGLDPCMILNEPQPTNEPQPADELPLAHELQQALEHQLADEVDDAQQQKATAGGLKKKRRSNSAPPQRSKRQRIEHSHVRNIHQPPDPKPVVRCFGTHKGARCMRDVATFIEGQLPVCAAHRAQIMEMMRCQGLLGSGFPCNTIAPWKPHGYALCKAHWSQGKCYFMELPVEVRLLIYSYLAPDKSVPVVCWNLRKDWSGVSTALFRVNKTIHDEYAGVFYGKTTFEVEITNRAAGVPPSIFMCPSKPGGSCSYLNSITELVVSTRGQVRVEPHRRL
jgi:hypothetical protein